MAAAWLAASCRMSSRDAAWATARLSWVSFRSSATAGSSARKAPLGLSVLLDMDPSGTDAHLTGGFIVTAAPCLVDPNPSPETISLLDLQQYEVVTHIAEPGEVSRAGRALHRPVDNVLQEEEDGDAQDGEPLHQGIEKVVDALRVCRRHCQIADGVNDDASNAVLLDNPK